jgi:hypothetical protein
VDAAIRHNSSYIAVIARDGKGEVCKAFLKDLSTIEPSTTKAALFLVAFVGLKFYAQDFIIPKKKKNI